MLYWKLGHGCLLLLLSPYSVAGETCIGRRKKEEEEEEATEVASFEFRQWLLFPRRTDGRSEEEEEEVPSLRATEEGEGGGTSLLIAASAVGHIKGEKGLFLLVKEFDNKAASALEPGKLLRQCFMFLKKMGKPEFFLGEF